MKWWRAKEAQHEPKNCGDQRSGHRRRLRSDIGVARSRPGSAWIGGQRGNVTAEQATSNVQIIVGQVDPPRLPRLGAAPPVEYDIDGAQLHGPNGLGNASFPCVSLHHLPSSDKLIADQVRQFPQEVTIVCLGPATVLARAMDLMPELPVQVKRIVMMGGALHAPGNAGPVSEFHFYCDPLAARKVLRSDAARDPRPS